MKITLTLICTALSIVSCNSPTPTSGLSAPQISANCTAGDEGGLGLLLPWPELDFPKVDASQEESTKPQAMVQGFQQEARALLVNWGAEPVKNQNSELFWGQIKVCLNSEPDLITPIEADPRCIPAADYNNSSLSLAPNKCFCDWSGSFIARVPLRSDVFPDSPQPDTIHFATSVCMDENSSIAHPCGHLNPGTPITFAQSANLKAYNTMLQCGALSNQINIQIKALKKQSDAFRIAMEQSSPNGYSQEIQPFIDQTIAMAMPKQFTQIAKSALWKSYADEAQGALNSSEGQKAIEAQQRSNLALAEATNCPTTAQAAPNSTLPPDPAANPTIGTDNIGSLPTPGNYESTTSADGDFSTTQDETMSEDSDFDDNPYSNEAEETEYEDAHTSNTDEDNKMWGSGKTFGFVLLAVASLYVVKKVISKGGTVRRQKGANKSINASLEKIDVATKIQGADLDDLKALKSAAAKGQVVQMTKIEAEGDGPSKRSFTIVDLDAEGLPKKVNGELQVRNIEIDTKASMEIDGKKVTPFEVDTFKKADFDNLNTGKMGLGKKVGIAAGIAAAGAVLYGTMLTGNSMQSNPLVTQFSAFVDEIGRNISQLNDQYLKCQQSIK